jgi:hypothetical protein
VDLEGCPGAVTIYSVGKMIPKEEVIPKTCNHEAYPQACAHYYSAIRAGEMPSKFTCSASHNGRAGTATKHWTAQHKKNQWQSFTQSAPIAKGESGNPIVKPMSFPRPISCPTTINLSLSDGFPVLTIVVPQTHFGKVSAKSTMVTLAMDNASNLEKESQLRSTIPLP